MRDLMYFNLSLKSENICRSIKENKGQISPEHIKDAKDIIEACQTIKSVGSIIRNIFGNHESLPDLTPVIFQVFRGKSAGQIIENLMELDSILIKLEEDSEIDKKETDILYDFFNKVSEISFTEMNSYNRIRNTKRVKSAGIFA